MLVDYSRITKFVTPIQIWHTVTTFCYILCIIDESVSQMERQVHINHPSN